MLFSSSSFLLGTAGQANYAAANAFLDALAEFRHASHVRLPALSINWGAWADVGMAAQLSQRDQARIVQQGISMITPEDGLAILAELLQQEISQVGVLPIEWSKLLANPEHRILQPFVQNLLS